jgi:TRAP-type C4-dicarboxylate transport system permease small subunit
MDRLNRLITTLGGLSLVFASCVLTWSVVVRYFLHAPTRWQDETAVFLIVGSVFLSAAAVQANRGHVSIDLLASFLPPWANRLRMIVVDLASFAFCAFFAWKSWTLLHEAWVDDYHSSSTWGPPLWIPYGLMSVGMTLLPIQILLRLGKPALSGARG